MEEEKSTSITGVGDAYEGDHHCDLWSTHDHHANRRAFLQCKINPGHTKFMTMEEFRQKGSSVYSDSVYLEYVWNVINRTARVRVGHISTNRPNTFNRSNVPYPLKERRGKPNLMRSGTGYLHRYIQFKNTYHVDKQCPCLDCREKNQHQEFTPAFSDYFAIETATHVIFDALEAEKAVFELYYDDEDRHGVKCLYGVGVEGKYTHRLNSDKCCVVCVTHDEQLAEDLRRLTGDFYSPSTKCDPRYSKRPHFMVSHPHGLSKRISFGELTSIRHFAIQEDESPITLKKGLKIRISGDLNETDLVSKLGLVEERGVEEEEEEGNNDSSPCTGSHGDVVHSRSRKIQTPVFDRDEGYKTFRLSSDVTISSPSCIALNTEHGTGTYLTRDKWWTIPEDAQFVTDNGTPFTIPHRPGGAGNYIKFEFYVKGELDVTPYLRINNDSDRGIKYSIYKRIYNYTMAACPGSSGAKIDTVSWWKFSFLTPLNVHFGNRGIYNGTGLDACFLPPYHAKLLESMNQNNAVEKTVANDDNQEQTTKRIKLAWPVG